MYSQYTYMTRGKDAAEVIYRGYRPPYCITYNIYTMVSAQQMNIYVKTLPETTPFCPKSICADTGPPCNA